MSTMDEATPATDGIGSADPDAVPGAEFLTKYGTSPAAAPVAGVEAVPAATEMMHLYPNLHVIHVIYEYVIHGI